MHLRTASEVLCSPPDLPVGFIGSLFDDVSHDAPTRGRVRWLVRHFHYTRKNRLQENLKAVLIGCGGQI